VVPEASIPPVGARVMDLQQPTNKMSKSADSPQGTIRLLDEPKSITKRIKSAVTDSDSEIRFDPAAKPGVSNLLSILGAVTDRSAGDVAGEYAGQGYGALKGAVAEAVVEFIRPLQERYAELDADRAEVARILEVGADRAQAIAAPVMARVREAVGLLPRGG
jgi:tryptophanyl-tRNA synthetase